MERALIVYEFRRTHLATGNVYVGTFNSTHLPDLHFLSHRSVEEKARKLIDRWNSQQPNEWRYEYAGAKVMSEQC
jgi:hypothetical protein